MGNVQKKMRDENDKKVLKEKFGKKPKHRCPICHRFSLFNHTDPKLKEYNGCIMCYLIEQTRKEKADEKRTNIESADQGE